VIRSVLVANRGEIARRIIRTCRRLGVRTVAAHSEGDRDWPFVAEADQAIVLGPAPARESYLNIDHVLAAARASGADAVHPGYGFLSENWRLAKGCEDAGLVFIGPPWPVLQAMGDKIEARRRMAAAGLPTVPGSHGGLESLEAARSLAAEVGYPVMLKAAAGGGGIGMLRVADEAALAPAFNATQRRAQAAFGSGALFLERYLDRPRHVEVQVLGDHHGRLLHLHERECSIQRRHQKLIEESPAPGVSTALKRRLTAAALAGAAAVGYRNAGTVEFIVQDDQFYFLEMNTRLQVEHPVTEEVTGLDLVEAQIRVASGEPLEWRQDDIGQQGAAIECRIYAEDAARGFLPSPGRITRLRLPEGPGLRVECGVAEGVEVSVHYDPLLAKLIAHGPSREQAIHRMQDALDGLTIEGVRTVVGFHQRVLESEAFRAGRIHTQMVDEGAFDA
jgi:acetyl-CoA carboxylase, biotin carboxylase subunit